MLESGITPGRIVHYSSGGKCLAAIIVGQRHLDTNLVSLRIFADGSSTEDRYVEQADYSTSSLEAHWHWPQDHKVR